MGDDEPKIGFRDIAPALEFMCWVVVVLAPLLRIVNGAAVTSDQFVMQVAIFVMALVGAIGLRVFQILSR